MAFEIMKSIVEAEQKADTMKSEAAAKAEAIKADARKKSEQIAAETKKQAKLSQDEKIRKAVEDSKPQAEKIFTEADGKCSEIRKAAGEKKSKAVEAVLRKVVGQHGNS